jgi:hypothetical protein
MVASNSVQATVPAIGTAVPAIGTTALKHQVVNVSGEKLQVTWTGDEALAYNVTYAYGAGNVYTGEIIATGTGSPVQYVNLPLAGGKTTVAVTAAFGTDGYYKAGTAATIEPEYALSTLSSVQGLAVARTGSNAKITWTEVSGATGYTLYKAQFVGAGSSFDFTTQSVTITTAWATVDLGKAEKDGTTWSVGDSGLTLDKDFVYFIVATGAGGAKSKPSVFYVAADPLGAPEGDDVISITVLSDLSVTIGWPHQEGATYKLARATLTDGTPGTYTTVTVPAVVAGWYTVRETTLPKRTAYRYKLTVTKAGVSTDYYKNLEDNVYQAGVNIGLSVSPSSSTVYATDISLFASDNSGSSVGSLTQAAYGDLTIDIYRAGADKSVTVDNWGVGENVTAYTKIGSVTGAKVASLYTDYTDNSPAALQTPLTAGQVYLYRIEVKSGANVVANKNPNLSGENAKSGYAQKPQVPRFNYLEFSGDQYTANANTNGTDQARIYHVIPKSPDLLDGARYTIQVRQKVYNDGDGAPGFLASDTWGDLPAQADASVLGKGAKLPATLPTYHPNFDHDQDYIITFTSPANSTAGKKTARQYRVVFIDGNAPAGNTDLSDNTFYIGDIWGDR